MESHTISLGDAFCRLSHHIQTDLQNTLLLMRGQDPELRTTEMRQFLARSRKKMLQIYALVKWLSSPGVAQCFRAIADFNGQLATMDQVMARNLDEMYFCHASIFSMRSRPFEIKRSIDILARRTYYNLPGSMFSCGKPDFPEQLEPESVIRDLNLFLRLKLAADNFLSNNNSFKINVNKGILRIEYPHYFAIYLTLTNLSETAKWQVLNCKLLVHSLETPDNSTSNIKHSEAENKLLTPLREIALETDNTNITENTPTTTPGSTVLSTMLKQCRIAALDRGIQVLAQDLGAISPVLPGVVSYFPGVVRASLKSAGLGESLSMQLWKSSFHGEFLFEIRLSRWTATSAASTLVLLNSSNNSSSSRDSGLTVNLYTELHYRSPTLVFSDSSRTFPIPGVSTALTAEEYIQQGCAAGHLVRDTLALLCEHKLRVLSVRLGATLSNLANSTIAKAVTVSRMGTSIELYCIAAEVAIAVSVDARTGKYVVDVSQLREVSGAGKRCLDLFIAEINNQDAESYFSDYLLKHGVVDETTSKTHPFAEIALLPLSITTLEDVLGLFELHTVNERICSSIGRVGASQAAAAPVLLLACGLPRRGLAYCLKFWEEGTAEGDALFSILFPFSHSSLTSTALSARVAQSSLPVRRSVAKKRGFTESQDSSVVPGGFVSAEQLAIEEATEDKPRYPPLTQRQSALVLYFLIAFRQLPAGNSSNSGNIGTEVVIACCLCRISLKATSGVLEPVAPTVVHKRQLGVVPMSSLQGPQGESLFGPHITEATAWATSLLHQPVELSQTDFPISSSDQRNRDILIHSDQTFSVITVSPSTAVSSVQVVLWMAANGTSAVKSACKAVPNSVPGHLVGAVDTVLLQNSNPVLVMDGSLSFHRDDQQSALWIQCDALQWGSSSSNICSQQSTEVFLRSFTKAFFKLWMIPTDSASIKTETFKRLKLLHSAGMLIRTATSLPPSTAGLRCLHFEVIPAPSTLNSCGCKISLLFALHNSSSSSSAVSGTTETSSAHSNGQIPVRPTVRYLQVLLEYTCSTMKGMGKSISTAELCDVTLRDVVSGMFERKHTEQELMSNNCSLLQEILIDFCTGK